MYGGKQSNLFGPDPPAHPVNTGVKVHQRSGVKIHQLEVDGLVELVSGRGSARGIAPSLLRRSNFAE